MKRRFAALAVLAAALVLPHSAEAQSAMCAEPAVDLLLTARIAAPSEAPPPVRDEDLPWCASAEDPRCAPLHGDSSSIRMALRQPLAATTAPAARRPSGSDDCTFTSDAGLAARPGISNRVERPPRRIG
jgi:hypothetical protein